VAVGRAGPVRRRVAIADDGPVGFGDEPGQAAPEHGGAARPKLVDVGRRFLEAGQSVEHVLRVDGGDGRHVGRQRIADQGVPGGFGRHPELSRRVLRHVNEGGCPSPGARKAVFANFL